MKFANCLLLAIYLQGIAIQYEGTAWANGIRAIAGLCVMYAMLSVTWFKE